ncbi:glycosyltransferase [Actinocorallia libanotica]|uniref:Glycosyltransferase 2-like domain-containing protein n=1 Tax=Actinocorallia libanotica TaxID=46162 RepID=A0ABN1RUM1_9ACTN
MPFSLSVVICSKDGEERIGRCLDALDAQTVRSELEVIVVDDGSLDETAEVVGEHDALLLQHPRNLGAPAARNTGWRAASAPVVAFLDDDCVPEEKWAELLLAAYKNEDVTGVGGPIVQAGAGGYAARFMKRNHRHVPLELALTEQKGIAGRFLRYLRGQWQPPEAGERRYVHAFCGGNMSYRKSALEEADGFDEDFRYAAEEEDLARRLDGRLLFLPDAIVEHHGVPSLFGRSLAYGHGNAMHYRKWPSVRPTIFPWPVLMAVLAVAAVRFPVLAFSAVLPLLLYPGWGRAAFRGQPVAVADPYVRLLQEGLENAGFVRGLLHAPHGPGADQRQYGYGALLVAIAALTQVRELWAAQLVLAVLLLTVPGCLLLRALRVPGERAAAFPLYVPAASLAVLLISGFGVNFLWPLFSDTPPLRAGPLLIGLELCLLALLAAGASAGPGTVIPWREFPSPVPLLLLPLAAAGGALWLNHGRGPGLAAVAVVGCLGLLVAGAAGAGHWRHGRLAMVLYAVALAMMWSYSLRGDILYGYDVATEYFAANRTAAEGIWHTGPHPDAYGAMLSITVLPAQLGALTGLPVLMVLKLLLPAVFAMLPVAVFFLARRVLPVRWAFVAAVLVVAQSGLAQQMPAVARQEIAMLMFAALLGAVLDAGLRAGPRTVLVGLFGASIAVSHYTTAYVTIGLLAGALLLLLLLRTGGAGPVAAALACCAAAAAVWYVPVTHSTSNLGELRAALQTDGLRLLPRAVKGESALSAFLRGAEATRMSTVAYADQVVLKYRPPNIAVTPAEDAAEPRYALGDAQAPEPAERLPAVGTGLDVALLILQQLVNVLSLLGALWLVLSRRAAPTARRLAALALPMLALLVLLRFSGTLAIAYNPGRAQLQAMILTSVVLCWLLRSLVPRLRLLRPARWLAGAAATAALLLFAGTSGATALALGGPRAANLADRGEDVERFELSRSELAAARWLGGRLPYSADRVYADRYGQLRLFAAEGPDVRVLTDLTPLTLDPSAWIYASRTNLHHGRARSLFAGKLAIYAFPELFVTDHYDRVYTNGRAEVFHR